MYSFCIMRAVLYFACYGACTRYFISTRHIKRKHTISSVATDYIVPTNKQNYQYNVPLILMNMNKSIGRVTQWASKQYSMYHHRYGTYQGLYFKPGSILINVFINTANFFTYLYEYEQIHRKSHWMSVKAVKHVPPQIWHLSGIIFLARFNPYINVH